jgi:hypothetical protein
MNSHLLYPQIYPWPNAGFRRPNANTSEFFIGPRLVPQIEGCAASATMRSRMPLQRGQPTSRWRNADGGFRVARLHAQIQIDHGAASVASDHQPMMLRHERGSNLRPEPRAPFGRKDRVEPPHGRQRAALGLPGVMHARHVLVHFLFAKKTVLVGHDAMLGSRGDAINQSRIIAVVGASLRLRLTTLYATRALTRYGGWAIALVVGAFGAAPLRSAALIGPSREGPFAWVACAVRHGSIYRSVNKQTQNCAEDRYN